METATQRGQTRQCCKPTCRTEWYKTVMITCAYIWQYLLAKSVCCVTTVYCVTWANRTWYRVNKVHVLNVGNGIPCLAHLISTSFSYKCWLEYRREVLPNHVPDVLNETQTRGHGRPFKSSKELTSFSCDGCCRVRHLGETSRWQWWTWNEQLLGWWHDPRTSDLSCCLEWLITMVTSHVTLNNWLSMETPHVALNDF